MCTCCSSATDRSLRIKRRKRDRESEGGWVGGKVRKRVQGCMSICSYTSLLLQELTSVGSELNHTARKHTGGTESCRARVNGECKDGNQEWLDHFALVPPLCTVSACAAFGLEWLAKRGWTLPIYSVPPVCPRRMSWLVNGGKVGQTSRCASFLWKSDSQEEKIHWSVTRVFSPPPFHWGFRLPHIQRSFISMCLWHSGCRCSACTLTRHHHLV